MMKVLLFVAAIAIGVGYYFGVDVRDLYRFGVRMPADFFNGLVQVESGGNRFAHRPGSQYAGPIQLGIKERRNCGIRDWTSLTEAYDCASQIYDRNFKWFFNRTGRPPSYLESYGMWNQGPAGLDRLRRYPDAAAADLNGYSHIHDNLPKRDRPYAGEITGGEFLSYLDGFFKKGMRKSRDYASYARPDYAERAYGYARDYRPDYGRQRYPDWQTFGSNMNWGND